MRTIKRMDGGWLAAWLLLAALIGPAGVALAQNETGYASVQAAAATPAPQVKTVAPVLTDGDVVLSQKRIGRILKTLPEDLDIARVMLVLRAYGLVDRVSYCYGGKSDSIGWDENWAVLPSTQGTLSPGIPSTPTATTDPAKASVKDGLDCSGFVRWCFINAACSRSFGVKVGRDTEHQWENSVDITMDEVLPGDLMFRKDSDGTVQHVGIVVECGSDGINVIHCGLSGVRLNALKDTSLTIPRRPLLLLDKELEEFHSRMEKRAERPAMRDYLHLTGPESRWTAN